MRQAHLEEIDIGVRMGGRQINNLRYADDTTLLAESKKELLQLVTSVVKECIQQILTSELLLAQQMNIRPVKT